MGSWIFEARWAQPESLFYIRMDPRLKYLVDPVFIMNEELMSLLSVSDNSSGVVTTQHYIHMMHSTARTVNSDVGVSQVVRHLAGCLSGRSSSLLPVKLHDRSVFCEIGSFPPVGTQLNLWISFFCFPDLVNSLSTRRWVLYIILQAGVVFYLIERFII